MGCYQDALCNILPMDWLDPYGRTPFAQNAEMSVDITIVETEDGIKASSVKNPPRAGSNRLMNAIKQALGVDSFENGPQNGLQRSDDLGKQDDEKDAGKPRESGTMKPSSSGSSGDRDRNPGSQGSRRGTVEDHDKSRVDGGDGRGNQVGEGAKEKAPKF